MSTKNRTSRSSDTDLLIGDVFTATVLQSLPDVGGAVIQRTRQGTDQQATPMVAVLPFADGLLGTAVYNAIPAGSTVLCKSITSKNSYVAYIIAVLNISCDSNGFYATGNKLYNAEDWTQSSKDAQAQWALLEQLVQNKRHVWMRNRAHNAPGDILPGDYDILDKTGNNGLHVGRLLTQLRGSALAFVDVNSLTDAVRAVGDQLQLHTFGHETEIHGDWAVHNMSVDLAEAFGFKYRSPVMTIVNPSGETYGNDLQLLDSGAIPLYRIQQAEGSVVDGVERIILDWPRNDNGDELTVHTQSTEPSVLSKRRQALDGSITDASALSLSFIKSPAITAAMQLNYRGEGATDLREPYQSTASGSAAKELNDKELEQRATHAAINKLIDTLLDGDYKDSLLQIMAEHGFSKSSGGASVYAHIQDKTVPGGATNKQQYGLPDKISLTDPVTGETKQYFASLSFITQEPDGSICIGDGYGSEIRMCRGNIYISPALDCLVRPGRDMSVMAGRHQAYNSLKTCTINTMGGAYIRAQNDLLMTGGTSGKGTVVLENDGTASIKDNVKPGLVIKSKSDLAMTTTDSMYIGRNVNNTANPRDGISDPGKAGNIIIDAGKSGMLYNKSGDNIVDASKCTICANNGSTVQAFTVNNEGVAISGNTAITGELNVARTDTAATITLFRDNGATEVQTANSGKSGIYTDKDVKAKGNILSSGDMSQFKDIKVTARLIEKRSGNIELSYTTIKGKRVVDGITRITWPEYEVKLEFEDPGVPDDKNKPVDTKAASALKALSSTVYTDMYVGTHSFNFPQTYSVAADPMPGMRWQWISSTSEAKGELWKEEPVQGYGGETYSYPGREAWNQPLIMAPGYGDNGPIVNGGYITNSPRQDK